MIRKTFVDNNDTVGQFFKFNSCLVFLRIGIVNTIYAICHKVCWLRRALLASIKGWTNSNAQICAAFFRRASTYIGSTCCITWLFAAAIDTSVTLDLPSQEHSSHGQHFSVVCLNTGSFLLYTAGFHTEISSTNNRAISILSYELQIFCDCFELFGYNPTYRGSQQRLHLNSPIKYIILKFAIFTLLFILPILSQFLDFIIMKRFKKIKW